MARNVVCISHASGASGADVGHLVAERLGFLYVDEAVIDRGAQRVAAAEGLDGEEARKLVRKSDAGRADYLKRFYDVTEEHPVDYDVVINTETLSPEQAAGLIAEAAA